LSVGPTFKDSMTQIKETHAKSMKSKEKIEKHVEMRRQKKQKLENQ
jgi:hypothetical protein